ncbi:MAG: caspase family protein [Candidatus Schekmanbacteria bacterium]|nr:caspase family protein [Candidatus Schekmanbacteria bacterium]
MMSRRHGRGAFRHRHLIAAVAVVVFVAALAAPPAGAAGSTRRALIVAIDQYVGAPSAAPATPRAGGRGAWANLDGAVTDGESFRDLLVARYGYRSEDIILLTNAAASRHRIIDAFRTHLLGERGRGDSALFFYAGHGSQVRNSKSDEPDGLDETIVPADANEGAADIRDKELRRLYNEALDRGIELIVIADSCHSGSVSRGLPVRLKSRYLPPLLEDIADASDPGPSPEERGALILSAAQDYQEALEQIDERGQSHGAFTYALMRALASAPLDESVEATFLRVRALLRAGGIPQEPVLAAVAERRRQPLMVAPGGGDGGAAAGRIAFAVSRALGDDLLELQGGGALGVHEGAELVRQGSAEEVRLRVTEVKGLSRSIARVVAGSTAAVRPGDLFALDRWAVVPGDVGLALWAPPLHADAEAFARDVATFRKAVAAASATWVEDPTMVSPTHVVRWTGEGWELRGEADQTPAAGPAAVIEENLKKLTPTGDGPVRLFVHAPPLAPIDLARIASGQAGADAFYFVPDPRSAGAHLVGRVTAAQTLEYAWIRPLSVAADAEASTLPVRSDWFAGPRPGDPASALETQLNEAARRLARIRAWLALSPPDAGISFPYQLALRNATSGNLVREGQLRSGEQYGLVLHRSDAQVADAAAPARRWVYVFVIDSFGGATLLFPPAGRGNVENYLPYAVDGPPPQDIPLGPPVAFQIGPPFGLDTYLLLSSEEALPNPDVLAFAGIRTRGAAAGAEGTPLQRLLFDVGGATRGVHPAVPLSWSLERISLRSVPAP